MSIFSKLAASENNTFQVDHISCRCGAHSHAVQTKVGFERRTTRCSRSTEVFRGATKCCRSQNRSRGNHSSVAEFALQHDTLGVPKERILDIDQEWGLLNTTDICGW